MTDKTESKWTPEYKKEYMREWREKNKDKKAGYNKKWRDQNPDYHKEWNENHPDYYKECLEKTERQRVAYMEEEKERMDNIMIG